MKTAMQELIKHIQVNATKFSMMNAYNILIEIEPYLEKEKEQIIDAHLNGQSDHHFSLESRIAEAEQHYKEKYNKNK